MKKVLLSACLFLMCVSVVSSVSAVDDNGVFCNMTNPFFEMTTLVNAGTPYYWTVDSQATHGVKLVNKYTVYDYPYGYCGGQSVNHFVFDIVDKNNYFIQLNLIDCRTNEVVDTLTSDMVN